MTTIAPPVFSSSTTRAVTNAPVVSITSPIGGRVVEVNGGADGDGRLATIENDRVDRSTLIGLTIELTSLQNDLALKQSILEDYFRRIADLEQDLSRQQAAIVIKSDNELRNAEAHLEIVSLSSANEKKAAERKLGLVKKGVLAGNKDELANTLKLQDTKIVAARLRVEMLSADLGNARSGIFVGGEQQSLQDLQREIRNVRADRTQIGIQAATIKVRIDQLKALAKVEEERIAKLVRADVAISGQAKLFKTVAQVGKQVSGGDTLAESVNCADAFVVAIFSERQAQSLSLGSSVTVVADGWDGPVPGRVERLVPKTTERVDLDYAVPFPPTERRELYAFIAPDTARSDNGAVDKFCSVGTWVTVSMPKTWVVWTRRQFDNTSSALAGYAGQLRQQLAALTGAPAADPGEQAKITRVSPRSARLAAATTLAVAMKPDSVRINEKAL
ncbi:HlyD family efflux transporter periplasmic adaptor subunit [Ensifer adhaerens]|uniref:HlyD family efflux transporter periplasmic adaptor subunit n=1 Tax=Ensifer adhaerens TaxID=106592 RepID=UPI00069DCF14|nr:HlyD family secretion protein [Ensifer adhaerens]